MTHSMRVRITENTRPGAGVLGVRLVHWTCWAALVGLIVLSVLR